MSLSLCRALCCNKDLVKAVRTELQEAAASAATTAAALAYAASSRYKVYCMLVPRFLDALGACGCCQNQGR